MTYYLKFSHQSYVNKTKPVVTADRLTQFSGVSMMSRWSRSDRVGLLAASLFHAPLRYAGKAFELHAAVYTLGSQ